MLIERGCWIGAAVTIYPRVTINEGCVINAGAVLVTAANLNGLYALAAAVRLKDLATS